MNEHPSDTFRWQAFFQHAAQPVFLLNRRRRILFVNRAWETCTGLALAEVRGRVCRRRGRSASVEHDETLLGACAPPAEALAGASCMARRRNPCGPGWWEIQFQPLAGTSDLLGILGTIRILGASAEAPFSLPEKLMGIRDRQAHRYRLDEFGGGTPLLDRVREQARLAAQTRMPITLVGEAGVGKEWLARAIHLQSTQRERYFACLDAERVPAPLLGEILYGPRSRQTGIGTLFLREPAFLPREWQGRIADTLRLGESPDFPRLMLGYRNDACAEVEAGRLLEDLHCAASPMTITIPPLRDRLAELPRFAELFLKRAGELASHSVQSVSPDALKALAAHAWPENLRELQEVVRDASRRAKGERIELADLPFTVKHAPLPPERRLPLDAILEQVERRLIVLALRLAQNNQTRAAELLEIWRPRLLRRMDKLEIKG